LTAPAATQIVIPAPIGRQPAVLDHPARFKVLRWGRRTGKTVVADVACLIGHGPKQADGLPRWRGVVHGYDVIWVAPDTTQNAMLWENTVERRYRNIDPRISVNKNDRYVSFRQAGGGTLWYRSMENIRAVRGSGAGVAGVVVEEAAHIHLEMALRDVIIPVLADEGGWLMLISTTNAGPDGNSEKRTPSYFNLICEEILAGQRSKDWAHWHFTARDNPAISAQAFNDLCAEYPDKTDPKYLQEVEAELLREGVGLAFAEQWDPAVHLTNDEPGIDDVAGGCLDWGYEQFGYFGIPFVDLRHNRLLRYELQFQKLRATEAGRQIGLLCLRSLRETGRDPPEIVCDPSMMAVKDGGLTIAEKVEDGIAAAYLEHMPTRDAPALVAAPGGGIQGKPQRTSRKNLMHEALAFKRDEDGVLVEPPKLRVHQECAKFVQCLTRLPRDPLGKEDVDTTANDHAYDAYTYWELARALEAKPPEIPHEVKAARAKLDRLSRMESDDWMTFEREMRRVTRR
jgi:hypothetical protein